MTAGDLLAELQRRGVELRMEGDRLRFRPVAAVTPDLRATMTTHKAEIQRALNADSGQPPSIGPGVSPLTPTPRGYLVPADLPERWREYYDERAAIREYDGGQPREHAEAEASWETLAAIDVAEGKTTRHDILYRIYY